MSVSTLGGRLSQEVKLLEISFFILLWKILNSVFGVLVKLINNNLFFVICAFNPLKL
jgi:hypothetical protein